MSKRAVEAKAFRRRRDAYPNARTALGSVMRDLGVQDRGGVLLPAYVGWSPHEGSGVFDPVRELAAPFAFYPLDRNLRMDPDSVALCIERHRPRALLVIHYFGLPDPALAEVVRLAQEREVVVIEDEAHAMYSDLVGGVCGRTGYASVYSLHKMLPVDGGGLLVVNRPPDGGEEATRVPESVALDHYDLVSIARARIRNAQALWPLLAPLQPAVRPLWSSLPAGVVPQTFPVLLDGANRDRVYQIMNDNGFGVVSLYHTMIEEISATDYPDAHWVSRHILNLPVHQDVQTEDLAPLVARLAQALVEAAR